MSNKQPNTALVSKTFSLAGVPVNEYRRLADCVGKLTKVKSAAPQGNVMAVVFDLSTTTEVRRPLALEAAIDSVQRTISHRMRSTEVGYHESPFRQKRQGYTNTTGATGVK